MASPADLLLTPRPGLKARRVTIMPADSPDGDDGADELVAAGDAYATVKGQRQADCLRFRRRRRRSFTMPYGYMPIPWWETPGLLLLEYPGFFTVALHGKCLDQLEPRISDRHVTWLRECDEAAAASLSLAVLRIDILHAYPSREEEAIGGVD